MSTKFLTSIGANTSLSDGSATVFVNTLSASSLSASMAVKTNGVNQLISSNLDIHDVNGLQDALDASTVTNPLSDNLSIGTSDIIGLPFGNTLRGMYASQILQTATINDTAYRAQNITGTVTAGVKTTFSGQIEAGSFKKTGGTAIQYLMADGTTLTQSANSGNSNFYLYNSGTSQNITPANGYVTYNNAVQANVTMIYINHLTRDVVDIEVFFKQINTLTEIYIQDQNISENYIQYNVTGSPVITVGAKVAIPVLLRIGNGTGLTNYPDGHNVLVSFFSNALEVDARLSTIETKTQNLSSTNSANNTSITGNVSVINSTATLDTPLHNTNAVQNQLLSAVGGSSYGFKFTITQPILIIRIGIYIFHWLVTTPNVVINFWGEGNNVTPIFTGALTQGATWPPTSYLYGSFGASPLLLPVGTYRVSLGYKTGMFYNGPLTAPFTFGNEIKNVQACSSTSPDGAYPNVLGTSGIVAGGFFWYDTPAYGSNIDVTTLNGSSIVSQGSINALNTKTFFQSNAGTGTQFSGDIYTTGLVTAIGSVTSQSGFVISGAGTNSIMRANGTYFSLVRTISPFGPPLQQTGTANFSGANYSVQSFYMPETMTVNSISLFRANTTSTTMSIALYNTSNVRIAFAGVGPTFQTTLAFTFTPVVLTGNDYYYFACFGTANAMYGTTIAGVSVVNSSLHPNIQFARCFFTGTTLPATLPLTGGSVGGILQPPFTLIGY